jgi:hypothetical protein
LCIFEEVLGSSLPAGFTDKCGNALCENLRSPPSLAVRDWGISRTLVVTIWRSVYKKDASRGCRLRCLLSRDTRFINDVDLPESPPRYHTFTSTVRARELQWSSILPSLATPVWILRREGVKIVVGATSHMLEVFSSAIIN